MDTTLQLLYSICLELYSGIFYVTGVFAFNCTLVMKEKRVRTFGSFLIPCYKEWYMDSIKFIAFPPFLTEVQGLIYVPSFWLYPILPLLRKDFLKFQRFYLINYKKQIDIHIFYLKISEWDKHIPYNRLYLNC